MLLILVTFFSVPPSLLQGPLRSDIIPVLAEPLKAEECEKNLFDTNGHIVLNYIDADRNDHGKNCRYIFHKSKGSFIFFFFAFV